jgi:hypothetical protein
MFWFELKKLTAQSYIDFEKYKPDRTEILKFSSNRTGSLGEIQFFYCHKTRKPNRFDEMGFRAFLVDQ